MILLALNAESHGRREEPLRRDKRIGRRKGLEALAIGRYRLGAGPGAARWGRHGEPVSPDGETAQPLQVECVRR